MSQSAVLATQRRTEERWDQAEYLCRGNNKTLTRSNFKPEGQDYVLATLGYLDGQAAAEQIRDEGVGWRFLNPRKQDSIVSACYWVGYNQAKEFVWHPNFTDEQLFSVCYSMWPELLGEWAA